MDVYQIITENIINLLEKEIVPWRKPWTATGLPRNLASKKPYRGVNSFLLSATKYVSHWLTLKQPNQLGGSVRKDKHGQIVCSGRSMMFGPTIIGTMTKCLRLALKVETAFSYVIIASGMSNNASRRKPYSISCRRVRHTSTIR